MDHPRSSSGNGEDNCGIPEDLRCKRSDGKQWRCSAMSMPDKTVCEKHYIQAKKRAANSALRASLKKTKKKNVGESDLYLESKSDDLETPLVDTPLSVSGKKYKEKIPRHHVRYSPDTPSMRSLSARNQQIDDDIRRDVSQIEDNRRSYKTPPASIMESSRNISERSFDASEGEQSDGSTDSSNDNGGLMCHQCRRNDGNRVIWCLRCDRRGYCANCISTWYSDIPTREIQRICPACRGTCNCKVCMRGDNLVKVRIREIPVRDKLEYFHCLLSSVLPVIKQIHNEQCSEVELERKLRGIETDLERIRLNADEQMCCNLCRMPIIDYHRHCANCSYDLCLSCCQDLREESNLNLKGENLVNKKKEAVGDQRRSFRVRLNLSNKFLNWKSDPHGNILCPPKDYGGCACSSLTLRRIFKLNWVAKLVKNVEEAATGCKINDAANLQSTELNKSKMCCCAHREEGNDNYLYCPSSEDFKREGIGEFRKHWVRGEPVIVQEVCESSSISSWDPMVLWRGIRETAEDKVKDNNRIVKAVDCLDMSEVEVELGQFMKGYSEGRTREDGWPEMLKLKDWPSPGASEEFLLYQRPEFISKLPLLEYIHSKWGLLNVAAKLPHYSYQNDVGPKISISYGTYEELGRGDSVTNLHFSMLDMVYLLVHTCEVKLKGWQKAKIEKIQRSFRESYPQESLGYLETNLNEGKATSRDSLGGFVSHSGTTSNFDVNKNESTSSFEERIVNSVYLNRNVEDCYEMNHAGAVWDVFRRQDVPKLIQYLRNHRKEFGSLTDDQVAHPLHDETVFLNVHHKRKLKEEFGIEPWSFEQHLGQAIFIPAGCPFQARNLQSTVQLGLDFISPESLCEAVRLAEEIRCLPNDHDAKLHMLEVGKISVYAASSAIKEVKKLVLDPKLGAELGFEDPNLTAMVSENLEKMIKRRQIACV